MQYQPPPHQLQTFTPQPVSSTDLETLKADIDNLIKAMQRDFAQNYQDASLGHRLKALLDLQMILRSQTLPPDQIQAVRRQVTDLQQNQRHAGQTPAAVPFAPTPQYVPVHESAMPQQQQSYMPSADPRQNASMPSASGPPSNNLLASLLASVERNRQTPVPSADIYSPKLSVAQPAMVQPPVPPSSSVEENPLIARLRASGILSQSGTPAAPTMPVAPPASVAPAPTPSHAQPLPNLSELLKKVSAPKPAKEVELTSASLKMYVHSGCVVGRRPLTVLSPRPHLISRLYEARPNQCLTCGKRFLAQDSKTKKAHHMDWHFRTNNRIQDTAQKGQSRSWYVYELVSPPTRPFSRPLPY